MTRKQRIERKDRTRAHKVPPILTPVLVATSASMGQEMSEEHIAEAIHEHVPGAMAADFKAMADALDLLHELAWCTEGLTFNDLVWWAHEILKDAGRDEP